jgi:hypothetical protein
MEKEEMYDPNYKTKYPRKKQELSSRLWMKRRICQNKN